MTLGTRQKTKNGESKQSLCIDKNIIKHVDKQKVLGVFIDGNLTWTTHIDNLSPTISTKPLLKQLSGNSKVFYEGYILPLIDYGANT